MGSNQAHVSQGDHEEHAQQRRIDLRNHLLQAVSEYCRKRKHYGNPEKFQGTRSWSLLQEANVKQKDIKELMKQEFAVMGLVTALLAGVAFSLLESPPEKLSESNGGKFSSYGILAGISLFCNVANVVYCTLFTTTVNLLVDQGNVFQEYLDMYSTRVSTVNFGLFLVGIFPLLCSILMYSFFRYNFTVGYVLIALCIVVYFSVSCFWWRIDSIRACWLEKHFEKVVEARRRDFEELDGKVKSLLEISLIGNMLNPVEYLRINTELFFAQFDEKCVAQEFTFDYLLERKGDVDSMLRNPYDPRRNDWMLTESGYRIRREKVEERLSDKEASVKKKVLVVSFLARMCPGIFSCISGSSRLGLQRLRRRVGHLSDAQRAMAPTW